MVYQESDRGQGPSDQNSESAQPSSQAGSDNINKNKPRHHVPGRITVRKSVARKVGTAEKGDKITKSGGDAGDQGTATGGAQNAVEVQDEAEEKDGRRTSVAGKKRVFNSPFIMK